MLESDYSFIHSVSFSNAATIVGGAIGSVVAVAVVAALAIGGGVVLKRSEKKSIWNHTRTHIYVIVIAFIILYNVIFAHTTASVAGYSLSMAKAYTQLLYMPYSNDTYTVLNK